MDDILGLLSDIRTELRGISAALCCKREAKKTSTAPVSTASLAAVKAGSQAHACYSVLADLATDSVEGTVLRTAWRAECLRRSVVPNEGALRAVLSRLVALSMVRLDGLYMAPVPVVTP